MSETEKSRPLDTERLRHLLKESCEGLGRAVDAELILRNVVNGLLYDGVPMDEVRRGAILSARALIEEDPAYSYVTARLLLHSIRYEVLGDEATQAGHAQPLCRVLPGVHRQRHLQPELLDPRLRQFDLQSLGRGAGLPPAISSSATLACRRSTTGISSTSRRSPHRAAAGLLYARGDGAGPQRGGA